MMSTSFVVTTHSAEETIHWGKKLGRFLGPSTVVCLVGDFGAGKTTFVKGLAEALGIPRESVRSPSFVLLHEYQGKYPMYHFDLFRLHDLSDIEAIGFDEFSYSEGISAIEWGKKIDGYLPPTYLEVIFRLLKDGERRMDFRPVGEEYNSIVKKLQ